ncbi:MAG: exodeoxyribonuclease VII large subunit, partial [Anaerotardibacter sp.]
MTESSVIYRNEQRKEAPEPLSVFAALNLTNTRLAQYTYAIEGEVSELNNKAGYKAIYFTIKDDKAALPCMMWVNKYHACGVELAIGSKVILHGKFNIYAAKGRMSFSVDSIVDNGEGNLRRQVAALAEKLRKEGLTDSSRKRPLITYPEVIGLVTSPHGAVVHDVLRTFRRRFPSTKILLAGVPVEGKDAHFGLIKGLEEVAAAGAEEIILCRGGG